MSSKTNVLRPSVDVFLVFLLCCVQLPKRNICALYDEKGNLNKSSFQKLYFFSKLGTFCFRKFCSNK